MARPPSSKDQVSSKRKRRTSSSTTRENRTKRRNQANLSFVMSGFYATTGESSQAYYTTSAYAGARVQMEQPSDWGTGAYQPSQVSSSQYTAQTYSSPSQYVSWPTADLPPIEPFAYTQGPYNPGTSTLAPPDPYSTESWPNAPWPSLHPDDYEVSSDSRSTSPNPSDLRNFGILLPDGRTWKCAHEGCTSQARFTRGCDLRKHFRRHTKSYYCRHEECKQRSKGFSSNKDRERHEQKHAPSIICSYEGCGKPFSRMDNMKDHVRRIHTRKS